MRMTDTTPHQQLATTPNYHHSHHRIVNEHAANIVIEKLNVDKIGTDEDDDDTELLNDDEINYNKNGDATSPHNRMENEKRLRREIANSNERRRMQSINAGFQSLKALLPRRDGEKMSKASILQQTADFIRALKTDKEILIQQGSEMKQLLDVGGILKSNRSSSLSAIEKSLTPSCIPKMEPLFEKRISDAYAACDMPPKKRRKFDNDSADEGVGMMSDAEAMIVSRTPSKVVPVAIGITQTDFLSNMIDVSCCTSPPPMNFNASEAKLLENSVVQDKIWEIELLQRQLIEIRLALDRERRVRLVLEEQIRMNELNRLQTLARLQSVPILDFPQVPTAPSAMNYPAMGASPGIIVKSTSPVQLRPEILHGSIAAGFVDGHTTNIMTTAAPVSLPDPVSSRVTSMVSATVNDTSLPMIPPVSSPTATAASMSKQPSNVTALGNNNAMSLHQSTSSKQSLAAIVEAIRHLEGDQLFVDVELQRPITQPQSMTVSAVVSSTTGGLSVPTTSHQCQSMSGANSTIMIATPDYTDSGISSPVSERQLFANPLSNFGPTVVNGPNSQMPILLQPQQTGVGSELNHVVAATAAALHNLCFPFKNPMPQLGATATPVHHQLQEASQQQFQVRRRPGNWTSPSQTALQ